MAKKGIVCSMSSTGCCFDNAVAESFFHTLKTECVYFERYESREHENLREIYAHNLFSKIVQINIA